MGDGLADQVRGYAGGAVRTLSANRTPWVRTLTATPGALSRRCQKIVTSGLRVVAALSDYYRRIVAAARQCFDSGPWFCCGSTSLPMRKEPPHGRQRQFRCRMAV